MFGCVLSVGLCLLNYSSTIQIIKNSCSRFTSSKHSVTVLHNVSLLGFTVVKGARCCVREVLTLRDTLNSTQHNYYVAKFYSSTSNSVELPLNPWYTWPIWNVCIYVLIVELDLRPSLLRCRVLKFFFLWICSFAVPTIMRLQSASAKLLLS